MVNDKSAGFLSIRNLSVALGIWKRTCGRGCAGRRAVSGRGKVRGRVGAGAYRRRGWRVAEGGGVLPASCFCTDWPCTRGLGALSACEGTHSGAHLARATPHGEGPKEALVPLNLQGKGQPARPLAECSDAWLPRSSPFFSGATTVPAFVPVIPELPDSAWFPDSQQ